MKTPDWSTDEKSHGNLFIWSAVLAFFLEAIILTEIGSKNHWITQSQPREDHLSIEAHIYELPHETHLVEEKKSPSPSTHKETVLNKSLGKGKAAPQANPIEETNQTEAGPKMPPSHGPVPVYTPSPAFLTNKPR